MVICAGCGAVIPISMVDGQAYFCPRTGLGYAYYPDRPHEPIRAGHPAAPPCPRCRRLERMLLVATAYLAPSNWYESPETLNLLDDVKRHLRRRYQDILNRHLAKEE